MRAPLVLGSSSPRRRELLARLVVAFEVANPQVDETPRPGEVAAALTRRLAAAKATKVRSARGGYVLGADTLVVCRGQILGKPDSAVAAGAMLALLAGSEHQVITAVALAGEGGTQIASATTRVWFHPLDEGTRHRYAAGDEAQGVAGAYRVQGEAAAFVARIVGSYTNIVGLPLAETADLLHQAGLLA